MPGTYVTKNVTTISIDRDSPPYVNDQLGGTYNLYSNQSNVSILAWIGL